LPRNFYVRQSGDDANGGTSNGAALAGASDGVTNGTNYLDSETGGFTSALIGHAVQISGTGGFTAWRLVTAVPSATRLTFGGATISARTGLTYRVGGACATPGKVLSNNLTTEIAMVAGDTLYIGGGVYTSYQLYCTISIWLSSADTKIIGDTTGRYTGDPGEVWIAQCAADWSTPTSGNQTAIPTAGAGAQSGSQYAYKYAFWHFASPWRLIIDGINFAWALGYGAVSTSESYVIFCSGPTYGLQIRNCQFSIGNPMNGRTNGRAAVIGIEQAIDPSYCCYVDSCVFFVWGTDTGFGNASTNWVNQHGSTSSSMGYAMIIACLTNGSDINGITLVISNNLVIAFTNIHLLQTWSYSGNAQLGAAVGFYNNTMFATAASLMYYTSAYKASTTVACMFVNNMTNLNYLVYPTATASSFNCNGRANVAALANGAANTWAAMINTGGTAYPSVQVDLGGNKGTKNPPLLDIGDSARRRGPSRAWFGPSPYPNNPYFNLGYPAAGVAATDPFGVPRKTSVAGNTAMQVGPFEVANQGQKETGIVNTGGASLKLTGWSSHSFQYPVEAIQTTITIAMQYDGAYAGSNKPMLMIRDGAEVGVADQDVAMTAGPGTWQSVSANFTPASAGLVTVILLCRSDSSAGAAYFDD